MLKSIKKYITGIQKDPKKKEKPSFFDVAKPHITQNKGPKENLSLSVDKILYGK